MSDIRNWLLSPPKWTTKHFNLMNSKTNVKKSVNLSEVIRNSENFPVKPDVKSICCESLLDTVPKDVLDRNIQSAYPVLHEAALHLCAEFLLTKLEHGSSIEKRLYKNMSLLEFIQRLLEKRALVFVGSHDFFMLRDGTKNFEGHWENIGTEKETKPLVLEDYLSYDELKLSALLSVSSYSYFVNNGRRQNAGKLDPRETIQDEGIIIGLIGPRLHKTNAMENQEIITEVGEQSMIDTILVYLNFKKPSEVLDLFFKFYEEKKQPFQQLKADASGRYTELRDGRFFDNAVYSKRLALSFDTLLIEANHRAQEKGKSAYVHVVGIGLGVWRIAHHQEAVFLDTFGQRIKALGQNLKFISDIDFSYFNPEGVCLGYGNGSLFPIENHPQGGIKIHFSLRQPFSKLDNKDALLVVSYAWDSNAMPGNEFWAGSTGDSSDSSTAASCQVSELHNTYINPIVAGGNLQVATPTGLVPAQEYLKSALGNLRQQ